MKNRAMILTCLAAFSLAAFALPMLTEVKTAWSRKK
jgi:hypothetical protein